MGGQQFNGVETHKLYIQAFCADIFINQCGKTGSREYGGGFEKRVECPENWSSEFHRVVRVQSVQTWPFMLLRGDCSCVVRVSSKMTDEMDSFKYLPI